MRLLLVVDEGIEEQHVLIDGEDTFNGSLVGDVLHGHCYYED